jgi:hypothetical protein
MLPFYILFKGKNLWDSWLNDGPEGCAYNVSESGWMESEQFIAWFNVVFLEHCKRLEGPKILIMDNHGSHISLDIIDRARENNVHILALPAHSSHLTQPLDVGVFKHVKAIWREIVEAFFKSSGFQNVEKSNFASLFAKIKSSGKAFLRRHIVAGFEQTGIFPINRHAIDASKLKPAYGFSKSSSIETTQPNASNLAATQPNASKLASTQPNASNVCSTYLDSSVVRAFPKVTQPNASNAASAVNGVEEDLIVLEENHEQMDSDDSASDTSLDSSHMDHSGNDSLMEELEASTNKGRNKPIFI